MAGQMMKEGLLDEPSLNSARKHEVANLDYSRRLLHDAETHGSVSSVVVRTPQHVLVEPRVRHNFIQLAARIFMPGEIQLIRPLHQLGNPLEIFVRIRGNLENDSARGE